MWSEPYVRLRSFFVPGTEVEFCRKADIWRKVADISSELADIFPKVADILPELAISRD